MSEQRVAVGAGLHRPVVDRRVVHVLRHLGEMSLAMVIGMAALSGPVEGALSVASAGALGEVEVSALAMALAMALPMAAWMRYRRHAWPPILEMSAAMIVPAVALLVAWRAGALSADTALMVQHAVMLPSMLAVMLHRRAEYVG